MMYKVGDRVRVARIIGTIDNELRYGPLIGEEGTIAGACNMKYPYRISFDRDFASKLAAGSSWMDGELELVLPEEPDNEIPDNISLDILLGGAL